MEALLSNGKRLGCSLVSTETGTFNSQSEWQDAPENQTEEGYLQCKAALEKHARTAEKHGTVLTIEAYYRNIIGTIDRAERLFQRGPLPGPPAGDGPVQLLPQGGPSPDEADARGHVPRLGDQIVIAHAKDVKASPEGEDLPAAGPGRARLSALPPPPGRPRPAAPPGRRAPEAARRHAGEGFRQAADREDLSRRRCPWRRDSEASYASR